MTDVARIPPLDVVDKLSKKEAFLVCAYEEDAKFHQVHLHGAISMKQFLQRLPMIPFNSEVVFYCTSKDERSSARLAAKLMESGYPFAKAMKGGVDGWKEAGLPIIAHA